MKRRDFFAALVVAPAALLAYRHTSGIKANEIVFTYKPRSVGPTTLWSQSGVIFKNNTIDGVFYRGLP